MKPDFSGVKWMKSDASAIGTSVSGAEYAEIKYMRNEFKIPFSALRETDYTLLRTYFSAVGVFKPHFIQIDTGTPLEIFYYVRMSKALDAYVKSFGTEYFWNLTALEYRELVT
jgi:hypothetical protein